MVDLEFQDHWIPGRTTPCSEHQSMAGSVLEDVIKWGLFISYPLAHAVGTLLLVFDMKTSKKERLFQEQKATIVIFHQLYLFIF